MTLTQLKYIDAIAQYGSLSRAAGRMFVSQPRMTNALRELEEEIGQTLFFRTPRGMKLTEEGVRFLGYARQVMQQMRLLEDHYNREKPKRSFSVSTQHYTFTARAFVELVKRYGEDEYDFSLLEERTAKVIENVRNMKSEIGILYMSQFNEAVLRKLLRESNLRFTPLFTVRPHVFLFREHPLAGKEVIALPDLEGFPCITFDQGEENAFYFSEEPLSVRTLRKQIRVTDRAAVANFLMDLDAYIITSGILPSFLHGSDIVARPLESDERMTVGIVRHADRIPSELGNAFEDALKKMAEEIRAAES
ncbi:MAG: LysR family transcriptional regulator [Schwartzia sp.]|nr:LysR family transcriptional regulator [Schwartzia sp. (in: firmicutes)]